MLIKRAKCLFNFAYINWLRIVKSNQPNYVQHYDS